MKISSIHFTPQVYNNKNYQTKPQQNIQPVQYDKLPTTQQYLAFTGGYSLDLAKTVKQLDILAQKNSSIYPKNIREWLGLVLEEGNKAKETLIDIHKRYFANLKDCFSLEDIKAKFPEFSEVKSSLTIDGMKGSLLEQFQKGELEYFDNEEDLSVQLIKLYWGEGFSLNDLKRYADGKDLYYVMKKLNIPTASRDYGHILKMSDAEYNERLTREMTEKRLAALDRKAQLEEGEPVHIKRGPLSPEHKKRISEGLKRYWEENPDRIYEMSERQKEFYSKNPEKSQELSKVLNIAWNIFGADRIKLAMSKFFKAKNIKMFNIEAPAEMTIEQTKTLKQFWGQNEWAKKSFSKNMKFAWKKVKEEEFTHFYIDLTPNGFKRKFYAWANKNGIDLNGLDFKFKVYKYRPDLDESHGVELSKYTPRFIDDYLANDQSTVMANSYFLALLNTSKDLKDIVKTANPQTQLIIETIRNLIADRLFEKGQGLFRTPKTFDAQEIQEFYRTCLMTTMVMHERPAKLLQIFEQNLHKAYEIADKSNGPLMLTPKLLEGVLK